MAPSPWSTPLSAALLALMVAAAVAAPGGVGAQPGGRVTCNIGAILPFSGPIDRHGNRGKEILNGAQLAIDEFSNDNVTINLIKYDVGCNATKAAEAMTKAADVDKVQGVIGAYCSMDSLAAAKVANEKKVPMISPTSTSARLTLEGGPYFFRIVPSDIYQGKLLGELAAKGAKKVGIIYSNDPYGEGTAHEVFVALNKAGIPVVGSIGTGEVWVPGMLDGILAGGADTVVLATSYVDHAKAAGIELREANFTGSFYASSTLALRSELLSGEAARKAFNGTLGILPFTGSPSFRAKYKAAFNTTMVPHGAAGAYDAVRLYLKVCAKDGVALPGSEIQPLLAKAKLAWGATGPNVGFDANGDHTIKKYEYYRALDGGWVFNPIPTRRSAL